MPRVISSPVRESASSDAPVSVVGGEFTSTIVSSSAKPAFACTRSNREIDALPETWRLVAAEMSRCFSARPCGAKFAQSSLVAPFPFARLTLSAPPVNESVTFGTPTSDASTPLASMPSHDFSPWLIETTFRLLTLPSTPIAFEVSIVVPLRTPPLPANA